MIDQAVQDKRRPPIPVFRWEFFSRDAQDSCFYWQATGFYTDMKRADWEVLFQIIREPVCTAQIQDVEDHTVFLPVQLAAKVSRS